MDAVTECHRDEMRTLLNGSYPNYNDFKEGHDCDMAFLILVGSGLGQADKKPTIIAAVKETVKVSKKVKTSVLRSVCR
jgi:hypothetical protein